MNKLKAFTSNFLTVIWFRNACNVNRVPKQYTMLIFSHKQTLDIMSQA